MIDSFFISVFISVALAYAGMAGLCLAMSRHYNQVWEKRTPKPWLQTSLRALGWLLIGLTSVACVKEWGWAIGPVVWLGFLSVGALMIVLLLPYRPRLTMGIASIAALGTPFLFFI